ncbi:MAG: Crp/Fnr family transcriptional regulator [Flavobacteriaceae bacterium]|jgi:CRP-like cAMP-binding protein|nr:Crp/Fnr family transcriptional regulator [Flavobacteriaceae bacterium]
MAMLTPLQQHIEKLIDSESLLNHIDLTSYFDVITLKKKEIILAQDSPCNELYFVLKGCMRSYYVKNNGVEQTIDFAIENWWITDHLSFDQKLSSAYSIQAVEQSTIAVISREKYDLLLREYDLLEKYFRKVYQRANAAAQKRITYLYDFTREELYFHFEAQFPWFIQRIPQYLIASYLGFSPEYLSEIKKKRLS